MEVTIFILYALGFRLAVLAVGLASIYMGYRLFILGVMPLAGSDIDAQNGSIRLSIRNAAPGTCFGFFGVVVISFMVFQGNPEYSVSTDKHGQPVIQVKGSQEASQEPNEIQKNQLSQYMDKLFKEELIKKEASEPLRKIANIYFELGWYDHAMALTALSLRSDRYNQKTIELRGKIKDERGY